MPLAVTQKDVKSLICCLNFAGASTCKLGICLSRGLAQAVIKEVSRDGLDLGKLGEVNINTIWEFSKVDTIDFRIVYDAGLLVNLGGKFQNKPERGISESIDKIFLTETGTILAKKQKWGRMGQHK
jgi:hypothetical protein